MTKEDHEFFKMDMGDNYLGLMAEIYLSRPMHIEGTDKKYGKGASKFIRCLPPLILQLLQVGDKRRYDPG